MANRIDKIEELIKSWINKVQQIQQDLLDARDLLQSYRPAIKQFRHWRSEIANREDVKKSMWTLAGEYSTPHHSS